MNNFNKFLELRSKYSDFIYEKYEILESMQNYQIYFYFSIPGLCSFKPELIIPKTHISNNDIDTEMLEYLVFNIGMVELLSYVKCTCSPNIIVKAGYLDSEQIEWFKKLYYNGLGEFLYRNSINISEDNLFNISCLGRKFNCNNSFNGIGNLIPVGGGKDSNVTLELLKNDFDSNSCFIINPHGANRDCASIAGYDDKTVGVRRILDKGIFELNKKGFLNGHTPFSAIVAFTSYLVAYLTNKNNIVLSNESSANESTVIGTNVNHQYSKTYEFECDFNNFTSKYFGLGIKYFSLLRPLSEFQIGMIFSHFDKYHTAFRSCNLGSKEDNWGWCCKCPKCLFVFIILSPFLDKDRLVNIFGSDLYDDAELLDTFIELLGYSETKPFECVGTYEEVRFAVSLVINSLGSHLPYLLRYYKEHYPLSLEKDLRIGFNLENNLDDYFTKIVKDAIEKYV